MSNPAPATGSPTYTPVNPTQLVVPTDTEIKDVLIAINNNLAMYMQVNSANLTTAEATLVNHDASITNLDTLVVQALAGVGGCPRNWLLGTKY
ncbi:hypothetical protein FRC09_005148 [Ceratobasidium sp. 395]|nr:hypothetical protein FRC09_005148 [Ceratobasidium sp. 395]